MDSRSEADRVMRYSVGLSPEQRLMYSTGKVGPRVVDAVNLVLEQRAGGRPLAYCLGVAEFAGLTFNVDSNVLIPRPETEFLVLRACDFIESRSDWRLRVLDLGCGSGCIGLTLAHKYPELRVTLTDASPAALDVARRNARRLGVEEQCRFSEGDWFNAVRRRDRFDIIVCNPPYITSRMDSGLDPGVKKHEPGIALFLDEDPEDFYFRLGKQAISHMNSKGLFAVEVGYDTAWAAKCGIDRLKALQRGREVHDFSGIERVIWATKKR